MTTSVEATLFERADRAVGRGLVQSTRAYLKVDADPGRVDTEVAALDLLGRAAFPAPVVIAHVAGDDLSALALSVIDGQPMDGGRSHHWTEVGRLIARLHRVEPPPGSHRAHYGPADLLQFVAGATRAARLSGAIDDRTIQRLRPDLDRMARRVLPLPTTMVHGDLQTDHVLVGPDQGVAGIVDWADSGVGDPAFDLAVLTLWHPERLPDLLAGYGPLPGRTDSVRLRLGLYWMLRHLGSAWWMAAHGYDPSPDVAAVAAGVRVPDLYVDRPLGRRIPGAY